MELPLPCEIPCSSGCSYTLLPQLPEGCCCTSSNVRCILNELFSFTSLTQFCPKKVENISIFLKIFLHTFVSSSEWRENECKYLGATNCQRVASHLKLTKLGNSHLTMPIGHPDLQSATLPRWLSTHCVRLTVKSSHDSVCWGRLLSELTAASIHGPQLRAPYRCHGVLSARYLNA